MRASCIREGDKRLTYVVRASTSNRHSKTATRTVLMRATGTSNEHAAVGIPPPDTGFAVFIEQQSDRPAGGRDSPDLEPEPPRPGQTFRRTL